MSHLGCEALGAQLVLFQAADPSMSPWPALGPNKAVLITKKPSLAHLAPRLLRSFRGVGSAS